MSALHHPRRAIPGQRGAAALIVTMVLFFAMVLTAVFVNRNLVFEQRSAANQYRSTQAFEAAEAGLEWARAQINNPRRLGLSCLPSADPAATSFRSRYLDFVRTSGHFTPLTWDQEGVPTPLRPSCVRSGGGWSCSCPVQGLPTLIVPAGPAAAPAFTVQFLPADKPGVIRVVASGCTSLAGACVPGSTTTTDATARVDVTLGLVAGLRTAPAAALTLRGAFDADTATLGVHNPDPATGIAIHAGSTIAAGHARLTAPAGATRAAALLSNDLALAGASVDRFFASYFGVDKSRWKSHPAVTRVHCPADCNHTLASAVNDSADNALIWVEGDLKLAGPITLGSVQHPVVIVVSGTARLEGAVALNGVLYSTAMSWNQTDGGAVIRGAALCEQDYQGNGAPEFFYDSAVLASLRNASGSFARVNGSWRDF